MLLSICITNGDEEMLRTLIYGGADLTLKSDDGKTATDLATEVGYEKAALCSERECRRGVKLYKINRGWSE